MSSVFKRKGRKSYYVKYKDGGRFVVVKGYFDKKTSEVLAHKLESDAFLRNHGIITMSDEKYMAADKVPLTKHGEDYLKALEANVTERYYKEVGRTLSISLEACNFNSIADIDSVTVEHYVADMRKQGRSASSINSYIYPLKTFAKWLFENKRMKSNPLASVKLLNKKLDPRRPRRPLTVDEVRRLLDYTYGNDGLGNRKLKMSGPERAMLYRIAIETGLRANELRNLRVSSFLLSRCVGGKISPEVFLEAQYTKGRRDAHIPLRADTAKELKVFFANKLPSAIAFNMPSPTSLSRILRADLEGAGIPYYDEDGRQVDFHALRHTTGSLLANSGVHPKVAQKIMRHTRIDVTMELYTHVYRGEESVAIECLPDFGAAAQEEHKAIDSAG